jgi:hypothetical protein
MFNVSSIYLKNKQECIASDKMDRNCQVFANSRWAIMLVSFLLTTSFPGFFFLPSQHEHSQWLSVLFGHFSSGFLNSLKEFPKG